MPSVVYSTATNATRYVEYAPAKEIGGTEPRQVIKGVTIKGGANLANKQLITPYGVATHVTDEEAEFLQKNDAFQRHVKAGFMQIRKKAADPEKVVSSGMSPKDGCAPRVPEDFKETDTAKPVKGDAKTLLEKVTGKRG